MAIADSSEALPQTRLGVLLFTDIVGSTDLKRPERLGGAAYAQLLARHNVLFETGLAEVAGARVVKHTGDGYFAVFPTASAAVRFALVFQSRMGLEPWGEQRLETRVGIHVGEIVLMEMAGQRDIVGLTADLAARIMGLAVGGQILMTGQAFNDARQFVNSSPKELEGTPPLKWMAHGRYVFKGNDEPLDVFEVGIENFSPLLAPESSDNAKRAISHDEEQTLGWRPAAGLGIPGRAAWELVRKLGEGGFGEVWLAEHNKLHQQRVFKFCFEPDRLRSLKREFTLFRLIQDALGDRDDVARLVEVRLDEPPFFLESEYTPGGSLADWAARHAGDGGIAKIPLTDRIEFMAKVADAIAAAHSVGVIHKDLKPSNILVEESAGHALKPILADFGIGMLTDRSALQARNITETGLTLIEGNDSSRTGTRMYAPPESLAGRPFTVQGDVYALGVLLYQLVRGDLSEPLAAGWERSIADELLREDIAVCVDGDPGRRLTAASELAERLRRLDGRRMEAAAVVRAEQARRRKQRNLRIGAASAVVAAALLGTGLVIAGRKNAELRVERDKTAVALVEVSKQKVEVEKQKSEAEHQRDVARTQEAEAKKQAAIAEAVAKFQTDMLATADPDKLLGDKVTVVQAMQAAVKQLDNGSLKDQPVVEASVRETIGSTLRSLARYRDAEKSLREALAIRRRTFPAGHLDISTSLNNLAELLRVENNLAEAEPLYREALEIKRKALPADDPNLAITLNNLALLLQAQNKLAEAELLDREALNIYRNGPATSDRNLATGLLNLASLLQAQDKLSEAEPLYREALELYRKFLPPGHPDIALGMNNLASVLQAENKLAEAEELFRGALASQRNALPAGHPDIALGVNNLATLLRAQNKFADAERLFREALEIEREALPVGHPNIAMSAYNLAELFQSQGKLNEAEPLFREALQIYRKALPAGHPNLATVLNNLALLLSAQNKLAEAEPLYREALEIQRKSLPGGHPSIALSTNNLALLLYRQNRLDEAESLFREAVRIQRTAPPARKVDLAQGLNNLAGLLYAQKRLAESEPLFREALEIFRKVRPAGHPDVVTGLVNLSTLLRSQNKLADAESLMREVLDIRRKALPMGHPLTMESAASLALCLKDLHRPAEAEPLEQEVLASREKSKGLTDPSTCRTAFYLAEILDAQNKHDEAEAVRKKYRLGDPATRPTTAPTTRP